MKDWLGLISFCDKNPVLLLFESNLVMEDIIEVALEHIVSLVPVLPNHLFISEGVGDYIS